MRAKKTFGEQLGKPSREQDRKIRGPIEELQPLPGVSEKEKRTFPRNQKLTFSD